MYEVLNIHWKKNLILKKGQGFIGDFKIFLIVYELG